MNEKNCKKYQKNVIHCPKFNVLILILPKSFIIYHVIHLLFVRNIRGRIFLERREM